MNSGMALSALILCRFRAVRRASMLRLDMGLISLRARLPLTLGGTVEDWN